MFNHAPEDYDCPFCRLIRGGEDALTSQADVVLRTEHALAFVASRWWPNNRGHVLVIPAAHYENLYDLAPEYGHAVHDVVRQVAIAIRSTYDCAGTSTRQHNEPAGYQDAWHYHVHVFPRYPNDRLYNTLPLPTPATPAQRAPYAATLRAHLHPTPDV
jgi:histidine triad (HIT) family protein